MAVIYEIEHGPWVGPYVISQMAEDGADLSFAQLELEPDTIHIARVRAYDTDTATAGAWTGWVQVKTLVAETSVTSDHSLPVAGEALRYAARVLHLDYTERRVADRTAAIEHAAHVRSDRTVPLGYLARLRSDSALPLGWSGQTVVDADAPLPIEWAGTRGALSVLPMDLPGRLVAAQAVPVYSDRQLHQDQALALSTRATLRGAHPLPMGWTGSADLEALAPLPIAWAGTLAAQPALPTAWGLQVMRESSLALSSLATRRFEHRLAAEWSGGVLIEASVPLPIEWRMARAYDSLLAFDSRALLLTGRSLPIEHAGASITASALALDYLAAIGVDSTLLAEWDGIIILQADSIIPIAWDGLVLFVEGNTRIWQAQARALRWIPEARSVLWTPGARPVRWTAIERPAGWKIRRR